MVRSTQNRRLATPQSGCPVCTPLKDFDADIDSRGTRWPDSGHELSSLTHDIIGIDGRSRWTDRRPHFVRKRLARARGFDTATSTAPMVRETIVSNIAVSFVMARRVRISSAMATTCSHSSRMTAFKAGRSDRFLPLFDSFWDFAAPACRLNDVSSRPTASANRVSSSVSFLGEARLTVSPFLSTHTLVASSCVATRPTPLNAHWHNVPGATKRERKQT